MFVTEYGLVVGQELLISSETSENYLLVIFKAIGMNYHFDRSSNKKKPPIGADKMALWVEAAVGRIGDRSVTPRTQKMARELTLEICPLAFTGTHVHK